VVSIKDIAKKAGVSISTVSYALNGSPKVTEETTAKILAIANELNYVPNRAARNLKKKETKIIGVFLRDYSGSFYGELLEGIKESLLDNGYEVIACSGKESHRFLPERMIDGAIILDESFSNEELLGYADRGHKAVVLDRELNHPSIVQVLLDNKAGATLAIDYLLENGHRKICVVTGPKKSYDSNQRLLAVRQALQRFSNIDYQEIQGNFTKSSGEQAAKIIAEQYMSPVAVFCLNDDMAIGMYNYLEKTELKVGEHVHIIGFDNIELSHYIQPRLATVDFSKRKWGALASEQLLKLISSGSAENERIYCSLVKGDSVKRVN
jgi:LacI family transcriptional regulator